MRKLGGYSFKLHQQGVCFCHRARRVPSGPSHHQQHTQGQICVLSSAWAFRHSQGYKKSKRDLEIKPVHGRLSALSQGCSKGDYGGRNGLCHRHTEMSVSFSAETTPLRASVCRLPELSGTSKAIPTAPDPLESSFLATWASEQSRRRGTYTAASWLPLADLTC